MKKRAIAWLIVLAMCISAVPALAANVFLFTEKVINIFEGETYQTTVRREGTYDGDGEIDTMTTENCDTENWEAEEKVDRQTEKSGKIFTAISSFIKWLLELILKLFRKG